MAGVLGELGNRTYRAINSCFQSIEYLIVMLGSMLDAEDIMARGLFNEPIKQNCREKTRKGRFRPSFGKLSTLRKELMQYYFHQGKGHQCPKFGEGDESKTKK